MVFRAVRRMVMAALALLLLCGGLWIFLRWQWMRGLTIRLTPALEWQTVEYGGDVVAFTPDDGFVATNTRGFRASVSLVALSTQTMRAELVAHGDRISSLTIDPTGRWLAAECSVATVCVRTIADGQLLGTIDLPAGEGLMRGIRFVDDPGSLLIVWGSRVERWQIPRLVRSERYELAPYRASRGGNVAISPHGTYVAIGADDGGVEIWDGATGAARMTLRQHRDEVAGLAFSPDEHLLATASFDRMIYIWQLPEGRLLHTMKSIGNSKLAFSPDGTLLASGDGQEAGSHGLRGSSYVFLWDTRTGGRVGRTEILHPNGDGFIEDVAFSPTGRLLGSADSDGKIHVWRVE